MTKFDKQELISNYPNCTCISPKHQFYAANRECIQPKLKGKNPFQVSCIQSKWRKAYWVVKGITQIGITRKGITQIGITQRGITQIRIRHRGITQRGITQRGITPRGITWTNQRPWQRPQERTEHARKSSTKSLRIFWSVLWEDGVREGDTFFFHSECLDSIFE